MPTFGDAFAERMLHRGSEPDSELPMPVTARLSKEFYETLGEQVAGELVTWFNDVDATYRADLREFNELNFSRFDAKLEQRLAEMEARIDRKFVELESRFNQKLVSEIAAAKLSVIRWMFAMWVGQMVAFLGMWLTRG